MVQPLLPQLQTFDANGYLSAFRQGEQDAVQRQQRENRTSIGRIANDQGFLAGQRAALEAGDMDWATRLQQMDTTQQARVYDTLGRLATAADTPERWNTLIAQMRSRFGAGAVQGFEDFGSRQNAIRISMTAAENIAQEHRVALLGEQRRLHDAQIAHLRAQDRRLDDRSAIDLENVELRRRQLDAQNLSRDRGFTLQSLTALSRARTPEEFQLVAQTLRPFLGRIPRFEERDRLIQSAMDSLEEFDMVPDENGRPSRVSRGWSPMVLAAIGPAGAGAPQGQPQAQPAAPPSVMAQIGAVGGVGGLRAMVPANPNGIPVNPAFQGADDQALQGLLPGAPAPQRGSPAQPQAANPWQVPMRPMPVVPGQTAAPGVVAAPPADGRPPVVPIAAPGGLPPGVVAPPQGGPVPVQGSGAPPARRPTGGVMAGQQAMVDEIEQQYGAPNTWGQNGTQPPPFSVIQRYWRAVHGGRAVTGHQYTAQGTLEPIGGAPQRGGGGGRGGGSSNAAANAAQVLAETVPMIENAAEYMLGSNVVGNTLSQIPGASIVGATGFNNARGTLEFGTSAIMHSLSGATTTQREFERYVTAFLPNATDMDNVRRYKLNSLMMIVRAVQARTAGGSISDDDMMPVRREMLRQQRLLLGLQQNGGTAPGPGRPSAAPGSPPRPATGGWGGAGGVSTQDLLNGLR